MLSLLNGGMNVIEGLLDMEMKNKNLHYNVSNMIKNKTSRKVPFWAIVWKKSEKYRFLKMSNLLTGDVNVVESSSDMKMTHKNLFYRANNMFKNKRSL